MVYRSVDASCSRVRVTCWGAADESDCRELLIWGRCGARFDQDLWASVSYVRGTVTCTTACTLASGNQYWF